ARTAPIPSGLPIPDQRAPQMEATTCFPASPKSWRLLRKLRCSTNRITAIVQAILVLHHASA
ncbi:hypothetical protein ACGFNN_34835, partial [Streptomyces sp. NPDC048590]